MPNAFTLAIVLNTHNDIYILQSIYIYNTGNNDIDRPKNKLTEYTRIKLWKFVYYYHDL